MAQRQKQFGDLAESPGLRVTYDPDLGGSKEQKMYPLAVLEARSPRSRCRQGCAPSDSSREESSLASSSCWWLLAILSILSL